jgi:3-hydroxyisobutyrate dehydrogenase-like beta-hydroxyacid dehydrogenase
MTMRLAMIGLGKMGANMARRLCRKGIEVVGYDRDAATVAGLAAETSMVAAVSVADAVSQLTAPRVVWLMLPSGDPTENQLKELAAMLSPGDVVIDGGNSNYKDSQRRGAWLAELGIEFMDAGTSGGVWGLDNGYCLMVGGSKEVAAIMQPVLQALAPAPDRGWAHVGPVGAGHYSKMLHNGIEYGMMQALAEGPRSPEEQEGIRLRPRAAHRTVAPRLGRAQLAARPDRRCAEGRSGTRCHSAACLRFRRGPVDSDRLGRAGRRRAGADAGLADALCQPGRHRLRQPPAGDDAQRLRRARDQAGRQLKQESE